MLRFTVLIAVLLAYATAELKYPLGATANTEGGDGTVRGGIDFHQNAAGGPVIMTLKFTGLTPGMHGFHIHQNAVKDRDCMTVGVHLNPEGNTHRGKADANRHVGDLGNVMADGNGNLNVQMTDSVIQLDGPHTIIGGSFVVHARRDDLGLGGDEESAKNGNAGARIACGTIHLQELGY